MRPRGHWHEKGKFVILSSSQTRFCCVFITCELIAAQDGDDDIFDTSPYRDKGGLRIPDLPDNLPSFKTPKNVRAKEDAISPTTPDESPGLLKV